MQKFYENVKITVEIDGNSQAKYSVIISKQRVYVMQ